MRASLQLLQRAMAFGQGILFAFWAQINAFLWLILFPFFVLFLLTLKKLNQSNKCARYICPKLGLLLHCTLHYTECIQKNYSEQYNVQYIYKSLHGVHCTVKYMHYRIHNVHYSIQYVHHRVHHNSLTHIENRAHHWLQCTIFRVSGHVSRLGPHTGWVVWNWEGKEQEL